MEDEIKPHNLKKFFIMIAVWLLTIVSITVGIKLYEKQEGAAYSDKAQPYIEQVIADLSKWDPEITRRLIAPEVLETIPEERVVRVMTLSAKLGELQSMEEPVFKKLYLDEPIDIGIETVLEYDVKAKYANGDAMIALKLLDRDGIFKLYRFHISSDLLVE
ncbi:MAG: hypothetical protein IBX47_13515 [Desulfuromonadales bacterium]|nr:hypothetical protein [Desulfuromonadales bacterium]